VHHAHVYHGYFVDDEQVEGVLAIPPRPTGPGIDFEQAVVLASKPMASFMRLAARPVGAHSKSLMPFAEEYAQDGVDEGCLTHARASGNHQHL